MNVNIDTNSIAENTGAIGQMSTAQEILNPAPTIDTSTTYIVDDYDDFKSHEVLMGLPSWLHADPENTVLVTNDLFRNFLQVAQSAGGLGRKLRSFKYVRGSLRVTIVVQGSTVNYGKRVISFDPVVMGSGPDRNVCFPMVGPTRCFQVPHIEIDPSKSATYSIDLPPPTIYGVYSCATIGAPASNPAQLGSYRVTYTTINALRTGTSSTPGVDIAMYVSLVSPKVAAPTTSNRFNWTSLQVEQSSPNGGVISGLLSKSAAIAETFSGVVPAYSQPLTLFSSASSATAKFLTWFGFSKPIVQDVTYVVPNAAHNFTKVDNKLRSEQLAMRSNNSITITGHDIPLYRAEEMETDWLCRKKGLIFTSTIATSVARDTYVATIPCTPTWNSFRSGTNNRSMELTPLGFATLPYDRWRGDLVYEIEIVASVFSRATLFVSWDPSSNHPTATVQDLIQVLRHWTVEVSGNTRLIVRIPWGQLPHHMQRWFPQTGLGAVEPNETNVNGWLTVQVLNPVKQNGSTDPLAINIYVHGENMKMAIPSIEKGSDNFNDPYSMVPEYQSGTIFTASTFEEKNFFGKFFGEEHAHTVKELASRMTYDDHSIDLAAHSQVIRRFAPLAGNSSNQFAILNMLQFLSLGYVGMRGSLNVGVAITPSGTTNHGLVFYDLIKSWTDVASTGEIPATMWNGFTIQSPEVNPINVVTVPYYYDGLFKPSYTYYNTLDYSISFRPNFAFDALTMVSLGDDGIFVGFRGVPWINFEQPAAGGGGLRGPEETEDIPVEPLQFQEY